MTPTRIGVIAKSPLFKLELKKLEELRDRGVSDVRESFQEASPMAVDTIERLMYKGSTESIQLKAAETILDRAGHSAISRGKVEIEQNVTISHSELTKRELRDLVLKRVKKIKNDEVEQKALEDAASAMTVEFEEVEETVTVEVEIPKISMGMLG